AHADDVRGACLEVLNSNYTDRFGATRVNRRDVLDINPANTNATVIADLGEADSLPEHRFDCVIFTQTLHLIPDMRMALSNVWRAVAPGGVFYLAVRPSVATTLEGASITIGGASRKRGCRSSSLICAAAALTS